MKLQHSDIPLQNTKNNEIFKLAPCNSSNHVLCFFSNVVIKYLLHPFSFKGTSVYKTNIYIYIYTVYVLHALASTLPCWFPKINWYFWEIDFLFSLRKSKQKLVAEIYWHNDEANVGGVELEWNPPMKWTPLSKILGIRIKVSDMKIGSRFSRFLTFAM